MAEGKKISLRDVFAEHNFCIMWFAMFLSTVGSFVLLMALSSKAYMSTNLALAAGAVFVAQWIAPLVMFPLIGKLANEGSSKKRLVVTDLATGLVTILVGLVWLKSGVLVFALLFVRGFLEAVTKTLRETSLKRYGNIEHMEKAASVFGTSYFLGVGVGALVSAALVSRFSILEIALIDASSFLVSAALYLCVRESKEVEALRVKTKQLLSVGFQIVFGDKALLRSFLYLLLTIGIFQSFHTLARAALPIGILRLPEENMHYFQFAFTIGIIVGAFFVSSFLQRKSTLKFNPILYLFFTSIFMVVASVLKLPLLNYAFYFLFAFFFEICFIRFKNELFLGASASQIGHVMALVQTGSTGILALSILLFGYLIDIFGLVDVTYVMTVFALLSAVFIKRMLPTPIQVNHKVS